MKDIGHHKKYMQKKGYRAAKKQAFLDDRKRRRVARKDKEELVNIYGSSEVSIEESLKKSVPVIKKMRKDFFH
jgi:hypothetical protein